MLLKISYYCKGGAWEKAKKITHIFPVISLTLYAPTPQNGQTHSRNQSNCLSMLDYFVGLELKS